MVKKDTTPSIENFELIKLKVCTYVLIKIDFAERSKKGQGGCNAA